MLYISVACFLCAGPPRWFSVDCYDCPECDWEAVVEMSEEDLAEYGTNLGIRCPACNQFLEDDSHYELLTNPTPRDIASALKFQDLE